MPSKVFIALGSNVGDRLCYMHSAIQEISKINSVKIIGQSRIMETEPIGVIGQSSYLNQIILIETAIGPKELLLLFKGIEKKLGRIKREHWAEREIDIDIILYNDQVLETPELCVPHKQILNRLFVLEGCTQIMPDYLAPSFKKTVYELYETLDNTVKAQKLKFFTS